MTPERPAACRCDELRAQRDYYRRRWLIHGLVWPRWMSREKQVVELMRRFKEADHGSD